MDVKVLPETDLVIWKIRPTPGDSQGVASGKSLNLPWPQFPLPWNKGSALVSEIASRPTGLSHRMRGNTCTQTSAEEWGLGWGKDEHKELLFRNSLSLLHRVKGAATFSWQPSAFQTSKSIRKDAAGKLSLTTCVHIYHCPSLPLFSFISSSWLLFLWLPCNCHLLLLDILSETSRMNYLPGLCSSLLWTFHEGLPNLGWSNLVFLL